MRVALEVWSSSYAEVEATCRLAEDLGVDGFYYGESPHGLNLDCWTTLGALARATERIRLGPVITNVLPSYRSLVLLAKQAATVQEISSGRVDLRTGVGAAVEFARPWWEPYGIHYPDYDTRLTELERALDVLPSLLAESDPAPPVTIAATGDRASRLAAEKADVWETSFCTPAEFAARNDVMTELVGGRPLVRSLEIDGFVAPTGAAAAELIDTVRTDRGASEDLGPILERALVGDPSEAVTRVAELEAVGVDQLVIALHDPHDREAIESVGEIVRLIGAASDEP